MSRINYISGIKIIFIKFCNVIIGKNNGGSVYVKINNFLIVFFWVLVSKNCFYYMVIFSCDMYKVSIFK